MSKLNEQQQAVVDSTADRLLVLAGAGAGKTHTMLERINKIVNDGISPTSILVLTFTNAAAFEMRDRYKRSHTEKVLPEFRTFHSFCYHLLIVDKAIRDHLGYTQPPTVGDTSTIKRIETEAKMQCNIKLPQSKLSGEEPCTSLKEKQEYELYTKCVKKLMKQKNIITFDILAKEVSELFTEKNELSTKYKQRYKYIFVDEFQDTDPQQVKFVSSFAESKFYLCGDALQCQPAGCLVELASGELKPIEEIAVGDKVKAYNPREGYYTTAKTGKEVVRVASRFADNIVEVKSASHSSRYTKDHLTYAKIHFQGNENCRCIYLMCNSEKGWWRVGECQLFLYDGNDFGPKHRMHEEGADKVWILDICSNSREASWYTEQLAAFKFGIPDTTWQFMNVGRYTPETMQELYDNIPDIAERAQKCLEYFGRDVNYPFFDKSKDCHRHMSKLHMFEVNVGNLIPMLMDIVVPDLFVDGHDAKRYGSPRYHNTYEQIVEINECEPGKVYSLEVDHFHNYISDGILTHNCIYQFRGTDNEFIKTLSKSDDWEKIRLFENYRSTRQICDFANKMSTYADREYRIEMNGQRDGAPVEVIRGAHAGWEAPVDTDHVDILISRLMKRNEGDKDVAILCRTNKEVKYICDRLNAAGILYSSGKRNEDALNILKSVHDNEYMLDWLSSFLTAEKYAEFIRLASQVENPDIKWFAKEYGSVPGINERGKAIVDVRKILKSDKATVSKVADIFKTLGIKSGELASVEKDEDILPTIIETIESQGDQDIYVGTIHSSKGLEYDTVYVMSVNDRPFQLDDEDMLNLYYVAITRAKNHLVVFKA